MNQSVGHYATHPNSEGNPLDWIQQQKRLPQKDADESIMFICKSLVAIQELLALLVMQTQTNDISKVSIDVKKTDANDIAKVIVEKLRLSGYSI